jgi:hypothetical protein
LAQQTDPSRQFANSTISNILNIVETAESTGNVEYTDMPPNPPKLLRTSRHFPYFTILRRVENIPESTPHTKLRKLAEYLDDNKEIVFIHYKELSNLVCPVSEPSAETVPSTPIHKDNRLLSECPNAPKRKSIGEESRPVFPIKLACEFVDDLHDESMCAKRSCIRK